MTRNFLPPFRGAAYSHLRSPLACRSAVLSLGGARRKSSASTGSARTDYIHAPPQNFLAMLNPMMRGSRVKTFVVRPLSSLLRTASLIGVELQSFFTYASLDRYSGPSPRPAMLKFVQSRRRTAGL